MNRSALCFTLSCVLGLGHAAPAQAQPAQPPSEEQKIEPPLVPATLSDALSCKSHDAALAFAYALFLQGEKPKWMSSIKAKHKHVDSMIGLYGYKSRKPVGFYGQTVDNVYFLKDWVVTLWPRVRAEAFIRDQNLERAPLRMTEQYYRFLDRENGPMLGVFEPTGGAMASIFARALGAEAKAPPPSDVLFVGCNYAPVTHLEFLEAAEQADAMAKDAAEEIGEMIQQAEKQPE